LQKLLLICGLVLIAIGIFWPLFLKLGLGRLPGDIVIERNGFRFYFPISTMVVVSVVASVVLWLFRR